MEKVYSMLGGRYGNDLFYIAAGLSLAKERNAEFIGIIPEDKRYRQYIVLSGINYITNKIKTVNIEDIDLNKLNIYKTRDTRDYNYEKIPEYDNICLDGFFQSEKYFNKELILDFFKIPENIKTSLFHKYGYLLDKNPISIHVRRGDYLTMPTLFIPGNVEFINKAMKMFPEDEIFIVSSDDIEWCKNNIKGKNIYYVDKDKNMFEDLYICTLCKGNIISNSTFSWWGAYLNQNKNNKVIVQYPWFGPYFNKLYNGSKDLIPDSWLKIK